MSILYRITFPNGKAYIGVSTRSLERRLALHRNHAKNRPYPLQQAIQKYGANSFVAEVLVVCGEDIEYLRDLEIAAIAAFGTLSPHGYNVALGGNGVRKGCPMSAEQRAKISKSKKGQRLGIAGRPKGWTHTPEAKAKIAEAGKGRIFSAERRAKIGATKVGNKYNVGRIVSVESRAKSSATQKGRAHSPEHCTNISAGLKGRKLTDEHRAKLSLSGTNSWIKRRVLNTFA